LEELNDLYFLSNIVLGDQNEKNEMGGACSTCGVRRGAYRGLVGNPSLRDHLEDPGLDGRIILIWVFRK
jgi:hypothetical protein